jgi:hypothetical protein
MMIAHAMRRRLLALALASLVIDPLAPLAGWWRAAGAACRDHVCLCARHCPPRRDPARSCHGSASEGSAVRASCSHDQAEGLASVASAVLPAETVVVAAPVTASAAAAGAARPTPGFQTIDPPPPKRA